MAPLQAIERFSIRIHPFIACGKRNTNIEDAPGGRRPVRGVGI
ncbi:hypothetical protein [Caulifigura coniformis]|nr:hypothetical protein [Caulifigura coniformis]